MAVWGSRLSSSPPKSLVRSLARGNSRGPGARRPLPPGPGSPREPGTGDQAADDAWGVVSVYGAEQAADGADDEEQGKEGPDHDLHVGKRYPAHASPWGPGEQHRQQPAVRCFRPCPATEVLLAMTERTPPQITYRPTFRAAEYDQAERLR